MISDASAISGAAIGQTRHTIGNFERNQIRFCSGPTPIGGGASITMRLNNAV